MARWAVTKFAAHDAFQFVEKFFFGLGFPVKGLGDTDEASLCAARGAFKDHWLFIDAYTLVALGMCSFHLLALIFLHFFYFAKEFLLFFFRLD